VSVLVFIIVVAAAALSLILAAATRCISSWLLASHKDCNVREAIGTHSVALLMVHRGDPGPRVQHQLLGLDVSRRYDEATELSALSHFDREANEPALVFGEGGRQIEVEVGEAVEEVARAHRGERESEGEWRGGQQENEGEEGIRRPSLKATLRVPSQ